MQRGKAELELPDRAEMFFVTTNASHSFAHGSQLQWKDILYSHVHSMSTVASAAFSVFSERKVLCSI